MSNPELNEGDLEGVSGGGVDLGKALNESHKICGTCPRKRGCGKAIVGLREYMMEHGPSSVTRATACPYYYEAE